MATARNSLRGEWLLTQSEWVEADISKWWERVARGKYTHTGQAREAICIQELFADGV